MAKHARQCRRWWKGLDIQPWTRQQMTREQQRGKLYRRYVVKLKQPKPGLIGRG